ncbi:acyl-CoA dehydrogenase family protein [Corynebacterium aquilae]|uniref:Acyl-CoA dehydrogenase n=1 Tax=Corynebacterium aquilae DSM 44791 TaxID=1431546 RepID=A0A1L7CFK0_9CORY|nr:acyl-CoA dehydrogenase family protein [Corynebacterium aquilae]APT84619.1 acyl-CoA dehydrogenase [Corynebacterium aquilae DSM 44791]
MTAVATHPTTELVLSPQLSEEISSRAHSVDSGETSGRYILPLLAQAGYFSHEHTLLDTARLVREIAHKDLSVAFSTWAHVMALTYIRKGATPALAALADELVRGVRPGVTGMAAAFKYAAGCGDIELQATATADGFVINGRLSWASNLYEDAIIVTAAKDQDGNPLVFALDADTCGVTVGKPFALLGMNNTASTSVEFADVAISNEQVISRDFAAFVAAVKRTFVVLQTSECLGLARACAENARPRLVGVNATFEAQLDEIDQRLAELIQRQENLASAAQATKKQLLNLRLDAAQLAVEAANIEIRVAGGAGYAKSTPASRRFREAAFIPVQSPSEAQLRWELAQLEKEDV